MWLVGEKQAAAPVLEATGVQGNLLILRSPGKEQSGGQGAAAHGLLPVNQGKPKALAHGV